MRNGLTDTIAAVSTAPGESGIGIVRISGEDAFQIADKVLDRPVSDKETHTIHFRHVLSEGSVLDEVLVSVMKKPKSYTGENTAEINCHGGPLVIRKVLSEILKAGARPAEPGEFTKRAFLNGKKDLSQAEAVMDMIQAKNRLALSAASADAIALFLSIKLRMFTRNTITSSTIKSISKDAMIIIGR